MTAVRGTAARPDPGLQPERTRLAWRRTTLVGAIIVLVGGTSVLAHGAPLATLALLAPAALAWVGIIAVAYRRISELSRSPATAAGAEPALLALLSVVLALCAGAAALIIAVAAH